MFFTRGQSRVYHILAYPNSGSAPPPCGVRADGYDLAMFKAGRPAPRIVAEKPGDAPLCKHCAAAHREGQAGG